MTKMTLQGALDITGHARLLRLGTQTDVFAVGGEYLLEQRLIHGKRIYFQRYFQNIEDINKYIPEDMGTIPYREPSLHPVKENIWKAVEN